MGEGMADTFALPCPFCGSTNLSFGDRWVICYRCRAAGPIAKTPQQARAEWNIRHDLAVKLDDAIIRAAAALAQSREGEA